MGSQKVRCEGCLHGWMVPRLHANQGEDTLAMEKLSKIVYGIPCSCGKSYIGETVRRLETRMKEHCDACQKGTLEKSVLVEHAWESHYLIKWEEITVVGQARALNELLLKEAIPIRLLKSVSTGMEYWRSLDVG